MAISKKAIMEKVRARYLTQVSEFLVQNGEEVMQIGTNEICIPIVEDGEEGFLTFTFKVPTGSRDGEPFDGYSMKEDFEIKMKNKAEQAQKSAEAKAKKIARDAKERKARAEIKAKKEKGE